MAVDMFLKFSPELKGESIDSTHKDEIQILAWSWGESNSASFGFGTGGGSGKVNMQDLSLTKYIDNASTTMMQKAADGNHFTGATLTIRKAGGNAPIEYVIIDLTDVMVSSVSTGGSGGEDKLTENVSLAFAKIKIKYTPQNDTGGAGSPSTFSWDLQTNKPVAG